MSQTDLGSDGTQTEGILEDSCIPGGRLSRPACAKVLGAAHEGVAVGDLGLSLAGPHLGSWFAGQATCCLLSKRLP